MPVLVRNNEGGPTVYTHKPSGTALEWAGRGDRDGGDVQEVEEDILKTSDIARCLRKGVLSIVDGAEAQASLAQHEVAHRATVQAERDAVDKVVDTTSDQPVAQVQIDGKGNVVDTLPTASATVATTTDSSGQPVAFTSTGEIDEEGKPVLAESKITIDAPGSALPPQEPLT